MCGIFGITFSEKQADLGTILADAAQRLSYRGYDTAGVATIENGEITLRKDAGAIDEIREKLKFDELSGNKGIAQLRWATFGKPSRINAQPHFDTDKKLVGAHNGNIINTLILNKEFEEEGMEVRSENDGEVCVHAVERYYRPSGNLLEAIFEGMRILQGDYAFTITDPKDDKIYVVKKGSSLALGIGDGFTVFSSDLPSILPLTKEILKIKDGEVAELSPGGIRIFNAQNGEQIQRASAEFEGDIEKAQKGDFAHFFLKEIYEQQSKARELVNYLSKNRDLDSVLESVAKAKRIFVAGCGTSFNAASLGAYYLNAGNDLVVVPSLAYEIEDLYRNALDKDSLIFLVSQSGETKDIINVLNLCQKEDIDTIGIVNIIGSTLWTEATAVLPLLAGYEVSVPATKTFTNQILAFMVLAHRMQQKTTSLEDLQVALSFGLEDTYLKQAGQIADLLIKQQEFYYLGYGKTLPVAMEGALKIKEVTYLHCEAMNSAEFKHGPLSSVHQDYPVLFVVDNINNHKMQNQINEVICRGGNPIIIGPKDATLQQLAGYFVELPQVGDDYLYFAANLFLQLIAYYASIKMGLDPDRPRNLSKTITVD